MLPISTIRFVMFESFDAGGSWRESRIGLEYNRKCIWSGSQSIVVSSVMI